MVPVALVPDSVLHEQVAAIGLESLLHEGVAVLNVLRQSCHLHSLQNGASALY